MLYFTYDLFKCEFKCEHAERYLTKLHNVLINSVFFVVDTYVRANVCQRVDSCYKQLQEQQSYSCNENERDILHL